MISVVVPIYKKPKLLDKFLLSMTKQSSSNFEIILTIDTGEGDVLSIVEKYKSLRNKITVIYNSKRNGRTQSVTSGIFSANGEYVVIWSSSMVVEKKSIEKLEELIKLSSNSDIVEFNARMKSPFRMKGKVRKEFNKKVEIANHPEVLAYSYPFEFNKVFKRKILFQALKLQNMTQVNSMFAIEHVYKTMFLSETYSSFDEVVVTKVKNSSVSKNNISAIVSQWEYVRQFAHYNFENKYNDEIDYAQYYHTSVLLVSLVNKMGTKVSKSRFEKYSKNLMKTDLKNFFETNVYIINKEKESHVLNRNKDVSKYHKNLRELQRWI